MRNDIPDDLSGKATKHDKQTENIMSKLAKPKKATLMIMNKIEKLYNATDGRVYVKVKRDSHYDLLSTDSQAFKYWVIYNFERLEDGTMLSDTDINTAISSINSTAMYTCERVDIYLRVGEKNGKIYLDLCNKKRQVLEISEDGHQVLNDSPVLFRRVADMAELPIPILRNGNDYALLEKYLNVKSREDLDIIVSYILSTFRPSIGKPILNLTGEAGTGKSMNTRLIRTLIDPARQKDLLKKEINQKEMLTTSVNQYLMAFDNMSGISKEGSDVLCVVSTGGSLTKRKLFKDTAEIIVTLKNAVILNGIDDISKRPDLVQRTIFIETPRLAPKNKKTEEDIWKAFNEDYPYIFGSLVNAVSTGLKNKGKDKTPYARMQDFGRFVSDCSGALGWPEGYWQVIYPKNQEAGIDQSIESDPFASAAVDMMTHRKEIGLVDWEGTSSELLNELKGSQWAETLYDEAWPKYNQVKARLRRIAPMLDSKGIHWEEKRLTSKRLIIISIG